MKRKRFISCMMAALVASSTVLGSGGLTIHAASEADTFLQTLESKYQKPAQANNTEVRWWLAQGSHTDQTIKEEIKTLHDQGFTGVELCMLDDQTIDTEKYAYGSAEAVHDWKLAIKEATKYDMSVGLTSGTHWKAANIPGLDPDTEAAGQQAVCSEEVVKAGATRNGALNIFSVSEEVAARINKSKKTLIGAYAYPIVTPGDTQKGTSTVLDPNGKIDLTESVQADGTLTWTNANGKDYALFGLWQCGTYQTCDPSQTTAYAINYFNREGALKLEDYFEKNFFDDAELVKAVQDANGNVQLFMDSLEFSNDQGIFWSSIMADKFQEKKGYDIRPYLPLVLGDKGNSLGVIDTFPVGRYVLQDASKEGDGKTLSWKIKNDLYDVWTDLIQEEMMIPLKTWASKYNMKLRAQISYGTKLEITEMGMATDYSESESLNMKDQPDLYRMWAGSTHIMDQLYSSETGAIFTFDFSHGFDIYHMNYALTEQDWTQMAYAFYAGGGNRVIWHGHSSQWGQKGTDWPGFEGMYGNISGRLDVRDPESMTYPEMNDHLGRIQQAMREGVSRTDLGILHLKYGESTAYGPKRYDPLSDHTGSYWKDMSLQDNGYTYDYFSPDYLEMMAYDKATGTLGENVGYQAILIHQAAMPVDAAKLLLNLAKQGLKVIIVRGNGFQGATITPYNGTGESDAELKTVMDEMIALDNVKTVTSEAEAYTALQAMDVQPRAKLVGGNTQLITQLRKDESDNLYMYAWNYCDGKTCGENHGLHTTAEVSMDGTYIPYEIDDWTGDVSQIVNYHYEDGRTFFTIDLDYSDTALYAFKPVHTVPSVTPVAPAEESYVIATDADSVRKENGKYIVRAKNTGKYTTILNNGASHQTELKPAPAAELTSWDLTVENWTKGKELTREETNAATGVHTIEYTYDTNKDQIQVKLDKLATWDAIPSVGKDVSGVGHYKTSFNWDGTKAAGAYLDLGTFLGAASVKVNGRDADPVNVNHAVLDISELLKEGANTLEITVATTLSNRLLQMGRLKESSGFFNDFEVKYLSNGLRSVKLIPFAEAELDASNKTSNVLQNNKKDTEEAQEAAKKAQEEAEKAQQEAIKAQQAAKEAQAKADQAEAARKEAEAKAKTDASAKADAEAKAKAAEQAKAAAQAAQKAAEEAVKKAQAAQKKAETALAKSQFQAKKAVISKAVSKKKKTAIVTWKKVKGAQGYVVQYGTKSNFKKAKKVTLKKSGATKTTIKGLKSKKKYYFRVRAYKKIDGKNVYTPYSAKLSVKIK